MPGQEHGPGTQDGDKAPKEGYFAAMLVEEMLPLLRLSGNSRSELDGKDDEDYPEHDGIGTDQLDQEYGEDSGQGQRPLLSNRQPS